MAHEGEPLSHKGFKLLYWISSQFLHSVGFLAHISAVPIYVYQTISDDPEQAEVFEIQQSMTDPHLTSHPETGVPIRRLIQRPNIASKYTPAATKSKLENDNLAQKGFTKYEKDKLTGRYHRTAGKEGPSTIDPQ